MISIFTTITADLSPEFREKCANSVIDTENLLQKIGELTGAMLITGGDAPKFIGSWNSVKNTYDILSGFLLYRSLLGVDKIRDTVLPSVENKSANQTLSPVNAALENHNQPVFPRNAIHHHLRSQNHNPYLTNEHLFNETLRNRLIDRGREINVIQQSRNFDGDCMDIERLSAFYKEESDTGLSNSDQLHKTSPTSYIHNEPMQNPTVQNSLCNVNESIELSPINFQNPNKRMSKTFQEIVHCDECSYTSYSRRNLLFHKARTHIRPYKCKHCGRGFGLMKDLRRHYQKKRDCKQYTFVKVKKTGSESVEEPIELDGRDDFERSLGSDGGSNSVQQDIEQSPGKVDYDPNNDQNKADVAKLKVSTSTRAETVSILPLNIRDAEKQSFENSDKREENIVPFNDKEVMFKENHMFLKKKLTNANSPTLSSECNESQRNTDDQVDENDYSIVNIKREVEDSESNSLLGVCSEKGDNASNSDLNFSMSISQDSRYKNTENSDCNNSEVNDMVEHDTALEAVDVNKCSAEIEMSFEEDAHSDTAVVDLSQYSLESEEDGDTSLYYTSPDRSHQIRKRQNKKMKTDLPYVVVQSETQKEPELKMTFPCSYCDYSTHKLKLIDDHVKRVHFKKFECSQCGTRFGLKKDLNRHYRRTHKMDLQLQRRGRRPVENYADGDQIDSFEEQEEGSVSTLQETDVE